MKMKNIKVLENLSLFCHFSGLISVMLGIVIGFMEVIYQNFHNIQIGIFIFSMGYALVKIGSKVSFVVMDERRTGY